MYKHVLLDEDGWLVLTNKPSLKGYSRTIAPGAYKLGHNFITGKTWLEPTDINMEGLIPMPDVVNTQILGFMDQFFTPKIKETYEKYGILYRAGILLHGKPGTGKTYTIHRVVEEAVKNGYIVLRDPDPRVIHIAIQEIRNITSSPNQPVLVIWEEFDTLLAYGHETEILSLLDGNKTLTEVVYLATTNYIEKIPPRLKSRPSRFNLVLEAVAPNKEQRRVYFTHKLHADDLPLWLEPMVEASEGLVLDFCKELILSVLVYKFDLKTEVNRLRQMAVLPSLKLESEEDEEEDDEE